MDSQAIPPLRIQKGSPIKAANRPLSELSPMGIRRNSPSFPGNRASCIDRDSKLAANLVQGKLFGGDSSPFDASPYSPQKATSPRLFWQGRETSPTRSSLGDGSPFNNENGVIPSKRSSIENLKKASRVKNSSIFEKEKTSTYDPAQPPMQLERPLASGRPLGVQVQGNAYGGRGIEGARSSLTTEIVQNEAAVPLTHELTTVPVPASDGLQQLSPSKTNASPTKSSLSKRTGATFRSSGFVDPVTGIWTEDEDSKHELPEGRVLHRRGKSVTFDQAPPEVNHYERPTPDPSSVASGSREGSYESTDEDGDISFERGSSLMDDSFDASLEDTEKTPVVLPEDWRFMSPEYAKTDLAKHEDDPFDEDYGSPAPEAHPGSMEQRAHQTSVNSVDSNGAPRPLPPLPPMSNKQQLAPSMNSLSGTVERISSAQRMLPSPPRPATISKNEIRRMSGGSFSMEERLKMMMIQEAAKEKTEAEIQRERRMRRAGSKDVTHDHKDLTPSDSFAPDESFVSAEDYSDSPRISRESILRRLQSQEEFETPNSVHESREAAFMNRPLPFDPDVPIPSREDPTQAHLYEELEETVIIKEEFTDEDDMVSIPSYYESHRQRCVKDDDMTSEYSQPANVEEDSIYGAGQDTPRAQSSTHEAQEHAQPKNSVSMSFPDFLSFGQNNIRFDSGLESYLTPTPPKEGPIETLVTVPVPKPQQEIDLASLRAAMQRPMTPEEQLHPPAFPGQHSDSDGEFGTPDSVIRHPVEPEQDEDNRSDNAAEVVPELMATVKAPGSHLQTRRSVTPVSTEVMAAARRQVSGQLQQSTLAILENDEDKGPATAMDTDPSKAPELLSPAEVEAKRVSSLVRLEIPQSSTEDDMSFGLEMEFDRVVQAQKRGYLMRQNTKVVVASSDHLEDGPPKAAPIGERAAEEVTISPRKISQQTWVAEPWNGKSRRKSIRMSTESPRKKAPSGPVPPMPGQASAVQEALGAVQEDETAEEEAEEIEDGTERGRLFVKVVGVKDLNLPLSKEEQSKFALTLDNGLHCVTTAWLDLGRTASIGQEFELVVLNDLEFQLTLQMKLEEPKQRPVSPTKAPLSPTKKQGNFGRLFGSPKKRKALEQQAQEEAQAQRLAAQQPPSAYDLVQGLVAKDGSFARAYISLSEHEKRAFGRPYSVDIVCFNEWAMEEVIVGSSRSKKSTATAIQRKPPYAIGKIEMQLLYVPKPRGAKDEEMPKSLNSAVRELKEAELRATKQVKFEGHLSQQGGDCPYWRRRFFKLDGSRLTAYHEITHQPRATINLAKASKLMDDKSALIQKETSTKGGGRRKSAFAEDEEGYMFVEEGFRIRFGNGEVIDFYAESAAYKDEWMKVLSEIVGKGINTSSSQSKGWTDVVLKREKSVVARDRKAKAMAASQHQHQPQQMRSPVKELVVPQQAASPAPMPQQQQFSSAVPERRPVSRPPPVTPSELATAAALGLNRPKPLSERAQATFPGAHSPANVPRANPRPGHSRTESYQPQQMTHGGSGIPMSARAAGLRPGSGGKPQPGSPHKLSREEKHKKTKSMIDTFDFARFH